MQSDFNALVPGDNLGAADGAAGNLGRRDDLVEGENLAHCLVCLYIASRVALRLCGATAGSDEAAIGEQSSGVNLLGQSGPNLISLCVGVAVSPPAPAMAACNGHSHGDDEAPQELEEVPAPSVADVDACRCASVSYTHLTLPTKRRV